MSLGEKLSRFWNRIGETITQLAEAAEHDPLHDMHKRVKRLELELATIQKCVKK